MSRVLRSRWLSNRKNRRPRGLSGGCLWAGHRLNTTPRLNAKSRVWFLTLDADRLLAVITARLAFGLPYRQAANRLTVASEHGSERLTWTSRRRSDGATAVLEVTPEGAPPRPAAQGLERFLVERYSLYSWWHGHLLEGTLSHPSWRVRSARLDAVDTGTVAAAGLLVAGAPHVLVGEPVEVRVHPFHRIRRQRKGVVDTEPDLGVDAGAGRHPGSGRP